TLLACRYLCGRRQVRPRAGPSWACTRREHCRSLLGDTVQRRAPPLSCCHRDRTGHSQRAGRCNRSVRGAHHALKAARDPLTWVIRMQMRTICIRVKFSLPFVQAGSSAEILRTERPMRKTLNLNAERWLRRGLQATVVIGLVMGALSPFETRAQEKVLNLYSARHYQTDNALYDNFTKQTGIKINRIELGDEQLVQRVKTEGANSPADAVLLVDAARLWRAQIDGLFQSVQSKALDERIPAQLRSNDGTWYGFST